MPDCVLEAFFLWPRFPLSAFRLPLFPLSVGWQARRAKDRPHGAEFGGCRVERVAQRSSRRLDTTLHSPQAFMGGLGVGGRSANLLFGGSAEMRP